MQYIEMFAGREITDYISERLMEPVNAIAMEINMHDHFNKLHLSIQVEREGCHWHPHPSFILTISCRCIPCEPFDAFISLRGCPLSMAEPFYFRIIKESKTFDPIRHCATSITQSAHWCI